MLSPAMCGGVPNKELPATLKETENTWRFPKEVISNHRAGSKVPSGSMGKKRL